MIGYKFDLTTLEQIFPAEQNQKQFLKGELLALSHLHLLHPIEVSAQNVIYCFSSEYLLEVMAPIYFILPLPLPVLLIK